MITYSIIQKSQLEGALRLDAEYYQPEYLDLDALFKKFGFITLKEISSIITDGDHGNPEYSEEGIPYIKSENIDEVSIDTKNAQKISLEYANKIRRECFAKQNDILLTTVGRIGTSTVNYQTTQMALSRDIARIHLKKDVKFLPEFIAIFFNSRIGLLITERESVGTVQKGLYLNTIKQLKIPTVNLNHQKEIKDLFLEAYNETLNSNSLYSQAENLLLEELGLKDFKVADDLSYIVNLSEIKSAHRADAEYFQPKYEKLIKRIKERVEMQELETIATTRRGSLIDPRFYDETEGTPYIRGKDFSSGRLEKSELVYIGRDFQPKNETRVNAGDLVFALIGSVGTSALVSEEFQNSFISNNTGKISIKNKKEILPEYLAVVFSSIVGKLQFEKEASQTAQPKISDLQVRNFYIPILSKPTQQKIADLVQKSHQARTKAKQLLGQAKSKVENLIEAKS
jgi:restriction endonuclease S subunit